MSLIARHLEANGIPTVVLGSALDIVEHCAVPRFLFTDFPLGNPLGTPDNQVMQREVLAASLDLLTDATAGGTTVRGPWAWSDDQSWRKTFLEVNDRNREALRIKGEERRQERARLRAEGRVRS